ncbi:MAG TPA: hypothetical protein VFC07_11680 [Verrucomicrobiae bacterium]|nr:hypothetical protein [Verrucomicrobiae bacterium]
MAFATPVSSPQRRKMIAGRAALVSDIEREGYDLAHCTSTWLRLKLSGATNVEVLKFAHAELLKMDSKLSRIKAAAVLKRLNHLQGGQHGK